MGKIISQKCIGHQRMTNGDLGSVIEERRDDGYFYYVAYRDKGGFEIATVPARQKPRIDVEVR